MSFRGHVLRLHCTGRDFGRDAPRRARDLLPGAVVESDDEREPVVVLCELLGLLQETPDIRIEIVTLADHAHAHAILMQLGEIVADEAAQQRPSGRGSPRPDATSSPS